MANQATTSKQADAAFEALAFLYLKCEPQTDELVSLFQSAETEFGMRYKYLLMKEIKENKENA
jgi:hypothetical protein